MSEVLYLHQTFIDRVLKGYLILIKYVFDFFFDFALFILQFFSYYYPKNLVYKNDIIEMALIGS